MTHHSLSNLDPKRSSFGWVILHFWMIIINSDNLSYIIILYSSKKYFATFVYYSYFVWTIFLRNLFYWDILSQQRNYFNGQSLLYNHIFKVEKEVIYTLLFLFQFWYGNEQLSLGNQDEMGFIFAFQFKIKIQIS